MILKQMIGVIVFSAVVSGFTGSAFADTSRAYYQANNIPSSGIALEGFSPVSYFDGEPVQGNPRISAEHDGVLYLFASQGEKDRFLKSPDKYVPAFGGWCAFGMAIEDKFPVDPKNYKIVDGKLYLFLKNANIDALTLWNKDSEAKLVDKANKHWKKVRG